MVRTFTPVPSIFDLGRVEQATRLGIQTLHASTMDVRCPAEALSLLYSNPPYDWECGGNDNQRLEQVFLEQTYRWLKPAGVLLFVIPQPRLAKCARLLRSNLRICRVMRLRSRMSAIQANCRHRVPAANDMCVYADAALLQGVKYLEVAGAQPDLCPLGDTPEARYEIPESGPVQSERRVFPWTRSRIYCLTRLRIARRQRVLLPKLGQARADRSHRCTEAMSGCFVPQECSMVSSGRVKPAHRALAISEVHRSLGRRGRRWHANPA